MSAEEWADFTAKREIVVIMRFSFFGRSGWQSDASRDPGQLFERERLEARLKLFRTVAAPSLAAQTDQNFHLFILTSKLLPDWAFAELHAAGKAILGKHRFTIFAKSQGVAAEYARRFMKGRYEDRLAFQTVLDDDDGLSNDYMLRLRSKMATLPPPETGDMRFVSFAQGYGLDLTEAEPRMFKHGYPFINLGLAMVGGVRGPNLLSIAHRKVPRSHPHVLVGSGRPMFVRSLHNINDSRVDVSERWEELQDWRQDADVQSRFPFLTDFTA